jgi:hypothetical protein
LDQSTIEVQVTGIKSKLQLLVVRVRASEDPLFIKLRPTNRELFRFQGNLIVVLIVVTTIVTESINGILVTKFWWSSMWEYPTEPFITSVMRSSSLYYMKLCVFTFIFHLVALHSLTCIWWISEVKETQRTPVIRSWCTEPDHWNNMPSSVLETWRMWNSGDNSSKMLVPVYQIIYLKHNVPDDTHLHFHVCWNICVNDLTSMWELCRLACEAQTFRTWDQGLTIFQPLKWFFFYLIEGMSEFWTYVPELWCKMHMHTMHVHVTSHTHLYRPSSTLGPYLRHH